MQLQPNALLQGRYRIVRPIAQGGMGAVYQATDERLGNTVALKQTLMADPAMRAAFEREARLLAGLHHPALPVVSDHFAEGGGQFLVMQFIPGDDLAALLARRGAPFTLGEALPWADRLLDALDYLHTRTPAIIHRDVKPQNLKLTPRGELVLLDFGLAKGEPAGATNVNPSLFGYTPQYAPLEQIQGSGTDARSDLYAVAATLYELLTGVAGPDALTRAGAAVRGEADPLRPADALNPQLPAAVAGVLGQALTLNPAMRPPSAAAMRDALRDAARAQSHGGRSLPATAIAAPLPAGGSASQPTIALRAGARAAPPTGDPLAATPTRPGPTRRLLGGAAIAAGLVVVLLVALVAFSAMPARTGGSGAPPVANGSGSSTHIEPGLPDPGGAVGASRGSPLPVGTSVQIDGWTVEVTEVIRGADANERVRKANSNNAAPSAEEEYVLLFVRARSTASADQYAFSQSAVGLVGSRDRVYRGYGAVAPSPRLDSSEQIAPGAVVEGWAAYLVGKDERDLVVILGDLVGGGARMMSLTPGASVGPDPEAPEVAATNIGADLREPAGVGETVTSAEWEIRIREAHLGDEAWQRIVENYSGSDPPGAGMQYALLYVEARYLGDGDEPDLVAADHFVGMAGADEVDQPVVLEPDPELFGVLYPGGRAEGWVVVMLPDDPGALVAFRGAGVSFGEREGWRYFALN